MRFNFRPHAVLLIACWLTQPAIADNIAVADKSAVEAAFLYNFALFTEWPELPADEFRICIMGSDPVLAALEPVKKKQIKEHPVSVTSISSTKQANACQIVFVGKSAHASIGDLTKQIGKAPVLVVAEANGYNPKSVIISLVTQQGRIAFNINLTAAKENSLTLSSKLLKLALQVF